MLQHLPEYAVEAAVIQAAGAQDELACNTQRIVGGRNIFHLKASLILWHGRYRRKCDAAVPGNSLELPPARQGPGPRRRIRCPGATVAGCDPSGRRSCCRRRSPARWRETPTARG